jgi:hypothetical protein
MKSSIVAYSPLPADVLAWLREAAQIVGVNAVQRGARVRTLCGARNGNVVNHEGRAR